MSVPIANINPLTASFEDWLNKTNEVLYTLSTSTLTSAANSTGSVTTGNVVLDGVMQANVIAVSEGIRGGTVTSPDALVFLSNTTFTQGTLDISSNVDISGANTTIRSLQTRISNGALTIDSSLNVKSNTIFVSTVGRVGVNTGAPDATLSVFGTANVSGNVSVGELLRVEGATTLAGTLNVFSNGVFVNIYAQNIRSTVFSSESVVSNTANVGSLVANNASLGALVVSSISISNTSATLSVAGGGTGANNASAARTNLGLGNVAILNTVNSSFFASPSSLAIYDSTGTLIKIIHGSGV